MRLPKRVLRYLSVLNKIDEIYDHFKNDYKNPKILLGKIKAENNNRIEELTDLSRVEFQVFSQWGDDGIIQYLANKIHFENKTFIEFGVENYKESNTRFLLLNNNWSGLVLDGSKKCIEFIRNDTVSWTHELYTKQAFITKENINYLIESEFLKKGFDKEVGILSIDIDGNDYWIWDEISVVNPVVVIVEYNSFFQSQRAITIPYNARFIMNTDINPYYWGASLKAFCELGYKKGYNFIGCNSNGNNAYFVRIDKMGRLKSRTCEEGYVRGKFRMRFLENGEPMVWDQILTGLKGQPVINVLNNNLEAL
jgi:hypothetical protein